MRNIVLLACVSAPLVAFPARANPADEFGLGARSVAMAGAVSADARDPSATYYNPSSMTRAPSRMLSLGYQSFVPMVSYEGAPRPEPLNAVSLGVLSSGKLFSLPFAVGFSAYVPTERLTRARTFVESERNWVFYDARADALVVNASVALAPLPYLSLGAGISFLAKTRGHFDVRGTAKLPVLEQNEYDSELEHELTAELLSVRYPTFALLLTLSDQFRLALVEREPARVNVDFSAELAGELDASLLSFPVRYALETHSVNNFIPRRVVLGAYYAVAEALSIEIDLEYLQWSGYESPSNDTFTELDAEPPEGLVLPLPPAGPGPAPTPPNFEDRLLPRIGFECLLETGPELNLRLRAGYAYRSSPVPEADNLIGFVDADRHILSAGVGSEILDVAGEGNTVKLNFAAVVSPLVSRALNEVRLDEDGQVADSRVVEATGALLGMSMDAGVSF